KSMPRFRPRVSSSTSAAVVRTSEAIRPRLRTAMKLMFGTLAKIFMGVLVSPHRHVFHALLAEEDLRERARADDGGELRSQDAERERDREAADGARAEREQHDGADEH